MEYRKVVQKRKSASILKSSPMQDVMLDSQAKGG
jgi:hypothetical protein